MNRIKASQGSQPLVTPLESIVKAGGIGGRLEEPQAGGRFLEPDGIKIDIEAGFSYNPA